MKDDAVTAAIVGILDRAGGCALLLRRFDGDRDYPAHWCFPGGRLRPGETSAAAATREVLEETGLTVGDLEPVGRHRSVGATGRTDLVEAFLTESWSGTLIGFPSPEHAAAAWVPVDGLPSLAPVGVTTAWLAASIRERWARPPS